MPMADLLKKVMSASLRFIRAFTRSFLLDNGKPRNLAMLALLLVMSWLVVDIYHFNTLRDIPVAVLDLDQSATSRAVVRYLESSTMIAVSPHTPHSPKEARQLMVDEQIAAVVLIPSNFSGRLKSGRQAEVLVGADMSNILTGRNVTNAIVRVLGTVSTGIRIRMLEKMGLRGDESLARAVPLVAEDNFSFNAARSYAGYLVPGLLLFLLYVYMTLQYLRVIRSEGDDLLEKASGLLGMTAHGVLLGMFFLYVYMPQQELTVHSAPISMIELLAVGFLTLALFEVAIKLLFRQEIFVIQVSVFLAMLSLMFSGITWPVDMFPVPFQVVSSVLPFTPIAHGMRILVHFPAQPGDLAQVYALFMKQALLCLSLIFMALAVTALIHTGRRMVRRRRTARENEG
jgi:ABC-2 type transport system permease protein